MKRLALPLAVLTVAALLYASAAPAHGCTCGAETVASVVDSATLVVMGQYTDVTQDGDAVMTVERYLKGTGDTAVVIQVPELNPCGPYAPVTPVTFLRPRLIFLSDLGYGLTEAYCIGEAPLRIDGDELVRAVEEHLGLADAPAAAPAPPDSDDSFDWLPVAALGGLAALAGLGALVWARRRA